MAMAQNNMIVQTLLYRRLIAIGSPVDVMAIVGGRGVMRCGAVWLMGPLSSGGCVLRHQADIIRGICVHSRAARSCTRLSSYSSNRDEYGTIGSVDLSP